jgi:hypothetical protein
MLKSDATRGQDQAEHLAQVHALLQAVASAISAIEKNDLPQFETHLAVQETICNRLSANQWMLPATATETAAAGKNPDAQLPPEIRQAYVALAQLNRVYAALLKRARRSAKLMGAFYRSHGAGCDPAQRHTWSCEV